jgi:hypothetical protein
MNSVIIPLPDVLGKLTAACAIFGSVVGIGFSLDAWSSPEARKDFSSWLKQTNFNIFAARLPTGIQELFKRSFGDTHFTVKCFFRSILLSICAIVGLILIDVVQAPFQSILTVAQQISKINWFGLVILISIVGWSIIADYIMLFKTRLIIKYLYKRSPANGGIFAIVFLVDFIAAVLLFVFWILVGLFIGEIIATSYFFLKCPMCSPHIFSLEYHLLLANVFGLWAKYKDMFLHVVNSIALKPLSDPFGILFLAGLLPSLWLWLYLASSLLTRFVARSERGIRFLLYFLDIDEHPFRSVGVVAGVVSASVYFAFIVW